MSNPPPAWFASQWEAIAADIRRGGAARVHAIEHLCVIRPEHSISTLIGGTCVGGCEPDCDDVVCEALRACSGSD